jgi:Tol biopolymer transport system component
MTSEIRFERDLPAILQDLYLGPSPDYRDEVLAAATRTRQRRAWTIPGRWLPMADIASRPAFVPRLPLRTIGVALVIIALLAVAAFVFVGTRPTRVPAPFGVARNGLIAYAAKGDIYTADPVSGKVTAIVTGPQLDAEPVFSPDGTRIAFRRPVEGSVPLAEDLVVVKSDGTDPIVVTGTPIPDGPKRLEWSPDSKSILATAPDDTAIWLFDATGKSPARTIAADRWAYVRPFRPPDGSTILINRSNGQSRSLVALELATGRETVLAEASGTDGSARWSPDGSKVVFNDSLTDDIGSRLFVVNADGTGRHPIMSASGTWVDIDPAWSPDGSQIAFTRYERVDGNWLIRPIGVYSMEDGTVRSVGPVPRDVRSQHPGPDDGSASQGEGFFFEWSPDGRSLLAYPSEAPGHAILIDAVDGSWKALEQVVDPIGAPVTQQSWQRLAE